MSVAAFRLPNPDPDGDGTTSYSVYVRALGKPGGKATMPVSDMFWGDRFGQFTDPFGHTWSISTHTKDLSPQEMEEGAKKFYAQMAQAQKKTA